MKTKRYWLIGALALALCGCVPIPVAPTLTPLEIQGMQSREFESDKDIVFASIISVFQDLGYIIKSADKETGFITAESAATNNSGLEFLILFDDISITTQTSATAFVERIGVTTRVRLNFVTSNRQSSQYGQTNERDTPILDAAVYQNAFERIENAIFIRSP